MFGAPSPHPSPTGRGSEAEGRVALGRETKGEVVLVSRLRAALERLNPALPPEASTAARLIEREATIRRKWFGATGYYLSGKRPDESLDDQSVGIAEGEP